MRYYCASCVQGHTVLTVGEFQVALSKFAKCLFVPALVLSAGAANAVVRYEFVALSSFPFNIGAGYETFSGGWVLETAAPIAPGDNFLPADLVSCSALGSISGVVDCSQQEIKSGFFEDDITIVFGIENAVGIYYYFEPESLYTYGVHFTTIFGNDQGGTLTVSDVGDGAVPEPATWAMMIAGFGLVGASLRKRRDAATA